MAWVGSFIALAITAPLTVVGLVLLRRRGDRIRASEHDPRVVSHTIEIQFLGSRDDLLELLSETSWFVGSDVSIHEGGGGLTLRTPANLRTWGQYLQIDVARREDSWQLTLESWPSRNRQTIDTRTGGKKAIAKFEKALYRGLRQHGAALS